MSQRAQPQEKDAGYFLVGIILVAVAIGAFVELNLESGVILLIIGLGLMAYESEKFRGELFHLFLDVLKKILRRLGLLD